MITPEHNKANGLLHEPLVCYLKAMMNHEYNFFATTAKGMEFLLAQELKEIGATDIEEQKAGVAFKGTLESAYKACLWSRTASRILLILKIVKARDPQQLYEGIQQIHWPDHLSVNRTFAVNFSASQAQLTNNEELRHTHYAALKVKDAVVDQFRALQGVRPSVDPIQPDVRLNIYLHDDQATISIDLSGESLHRRGYREEGSEAPLKENLAAAILLLCQWSPLETRDFIDPMCGSGTLPIEAALIAARVAPGLLRKSFGFMGWCGHDPLLFKRLVQEARDMVVTDQKKLPRIAGYDKDARAISIALSNLEKAQLKGLVHFEKREVKQCEPSSERGILVVNPPYGERLGEVERLKVLYQQLGDILKQKFKGWEGYILTSNPDLAKCVGLKTSRRFVLFNGSIECRLLKYDMY